MKHQQSRKFQLSSVSELNRRLAALPPRRHHLELSGWPSVQLSPVGMFCTSAAADGDQAKAKPAGLESRLEARREAPRLSLAGTSTRLSIASCSPVYLISRATSPLPIGCSKRGYTSFSICLCPSFRAGQTSSLRSPLPLSYGASWWAGRRSWVSVWGFC